MGALTARRRWAIGALAAVAWSVTRAVTGDQVVNAGGWPAFSRFWRAVVDPELGAAFLRTTLDATATTAAYAVLGTVASVGLGLLAAPLVATRWWEPAGVAPRRVASLARLVVRSVFVVPRAVHEVIWALLLVRVFGLDPWVAVLAITAKVYGELLDDADPRAYRALRAAGSRRTTALAYGLVPLVRHDLVSYGFYRLECAIRSAAVLGIVGAGGLGFQLDLSFESLRYGEIWTLIVALMLLSGVVDAWSAAVRRGHASRRRERISWWLVVCSAPVAAWYVGLDPTELWSATTRSRAVEVIRDLLPPRLGPGGWGELVSASLDTVAMSVLAWVIAAGGGLAAAVVAARPSVRARVPRRLAGSVARLVLLLLRAVPAPVWAFLAVLVLFPGLVPGAVALGVYNLGVLGRLFAEVVEDHDDRARRQLASAGAGTVTQYAYAVLPTTAPRLTSLALYRWEVIARETVVVGVVGAGGLGRLLQEHLVARDLAAVAGVIGALVVITGLVDLVSARARAVLR